jgi:hypothetical protein
VSHRVVVALYTSHVVLISCFSSRIPKLVMSIEQLWRSLAFQKCNISSPQDDYGQTTVDPEQKRDHEGVVCHSSAASALIFDSAFIRLM